MIGDNISMHLFLKIISSSDLPFDFLLNRLIERAGVTVKEGDQSSSMELDEGLGVA